MNNMIGRKRPRAEQRPVRLGRKHFFCLIVGAPVLICCSNLYALFRATDSVYLNDQRGIGGINNGNKLRRPASTSRLPFAGIERKNEREEEEERRRRLRLESSKHSKETSSLPNFHVFQIAKTHTGSTLLNCILQGMLEESVDVGYAFLRRTKAGNKNYNKGNRDGLVLLHNGQIQSATPEAINATVVTKTHIVDVDELQQTYGGAFDQIIYVAAIRNGIGAADEDGGSIGIEERYCNDYPNVICLDYEEFTYDTSSTAFAGRGGGGGGGGDEEGDATDPIAEAVQKVRDSLLEEFDVLQNVDMDIDRAVQRVKLMEKTTKEMTNMSFEVHEDRFGIHGGHRHRADKKGGQQLIQEDEEHRKEPQPPQSPLRFVHVTSLYSVDKCDARFCPYGQDQSVAVASMQRARDHTNKKQKKALASVTLATSVFSNDAIAVPNDFVRLPDLNRSTATEYPTLSPPKNLPFVNDVFSNLREASSLDVIEPYDYVVYTNADIIVREDFYDVISIAIQQGYDAFTINRQTITKGIGGEDESDDVFRPYTAEDLDIIYKTSGDIHPGTDCFVVMRSIFDRIDMGNVFLGYPPFGKLLLAQVEHLAQSYTTFASDELKVTFHLGNDKNWHEGEHDGNCEYTRTNLGNTYYALQHIWTRACEMTIEKNDDSHAVPHLKYIGDGSPSRTCVLLLQKFRDADACNDSEEYDDSEIEYAEDDAVDSTPTDDVSDSPVVFQFLVGVEGTGHHLHRDIYKRSPAHERLIKYGLLSDVRRLLLSLWNKKRPTEAVFSAPCALSENNEDGWWKQENDAINGEELFENLASHLKRIEHKARRKIQEDNTAVQGTDLVVAVNSGSIGPSEEISPFLSYPLLFGPCRSLQYPDLDIIYEACNAAQVRCQHAVTYRDPYRVLKSTTMNRQFASRHVQLQTLNSMLKVVQGHMLSHPDRLVACWESDKGVSGGVQDLGRIFGWDDPAKFSRFYNKLFLEPSPLSDQDKSEITKEKELEIYMNSMVKAMESIKALCSHQLMSNTEKSMSSATKASPDEKQRTAKTVGGGARAPALKFSSEQDYCSKNMQNEKAYKCMVPSTDGGPAEIAYYSNKEFESMQGNGEAISMFLNGTTGETVKWVGRRFNRLMSINGAALVARACGLLIGFPKDLGDSSSESFVDCVDYRHSALPRELQNIQQSSTCQLPDLIRSKSRYHDISKYWKEASNRIATSHPAEWKHFSDIRADAKHFTLAYAGIRQGSYRCSACSNNEKNGAAVIHIRSGDVFKRKGGVPSYKGQPPLDFYTKAIQHSGASRVTIIAEDKANPVLSALLEYDWTRDGGSPVVIQVHIGRDFDMDLKALFCARIVVLGNTSLNVLAPFSPNLEKIYIGWITQQTVPEPHRICTECNIPNEKQGSAVLLSKMSSAQTYGYYAGNYSPYKEWKGTSQQRKEMLSYDVGYLVPLHLPVAALPAPSTPQIE